MRMLFWILIGIIYMIVAYMSHSIIEKVIGG